MKKVILVFATGCFLVSCNNSQQSEALQAQQRTIDSMKEEAGKQRIIDSMNAVAAQPQPVSMETPSVTTVARSHTSTHRASGGGTTNTNNTTTTTTTTAPAAATTTTAKKKGWTGAEKGAVIGAGAGIITGAIADKKNRGAGAVIGGLLGAGAGAGTGAIIDKEKKKKEEQ